MSRFTITSLPLPGLKLVRRQLVGDSRGWLTRLFCADELHDAGWDRPISQINHTRTAERGAVRGLHFQYPPHAELKLVSCISGEVWDVAVDLRAGSPTFLQWHAERLSAADATALLIPEGFAHGFQTLTADAELLYCHSAPYAPAAEGGVHPLDPALGISWPLPVVALSPRDTGHAPLTESFAGI